MIALSTLDVPVVAVCQWVELLSRRRRRTRRRRRSS